MLNNTIGIDTNLFVERYRDAAVNSDIGRTVTGLSLTLREKKLFRNPAWNRLYDCHLPFLRQKFPASDALKFILFEPQPSVPAMIPAFTK
jgi:hypothetical protein